MANEQNPNELHDACNQRFIELANTLKDEGVPVNVISWALMSACGTYATYSVVGNEGSLNPSGVDKISDAFRQNLLTLQRLRQAQQGEQEES